MTRRIIRRQSPIPGGRDQQGSALDHAIYKAVEADASHHAVSRSWVVKVILAAHYGIETQLYAELPIAPKLRRVK
jgi:hypothetical protein